MYGIDESIQSESGFKTVEAGIQENFLLKEVSYGASSAKDGAVNALIFNFDQEGTSFRFMEFAIDNQRETTNGEKYYDTLTKNGKKPEKEKGQFVVDYVQRVYRDQAARIKHIMSKFVAEDKCVISGVNTFEAFSRAVVNVLGDSYVGKKLRLKIVLNNKDYATFPKYANFIELQSTSPSTLKWSPKYDRKDKQVPDGAKGNPQDVEY